MLGQAMHLMLWTGIVLLGLVALTYLVEGLYWLMDLLLTAVGCLVGALAFLVWAIREGIARGLGWCWRKARDAWRR